MCSQNFPVLIFYFAVVLLSSFAQPPHPKGQGKKFLQPASPARQSPNICATLSHRELSGQCTSTTDPTWGQARLAQFSYLPRASSALPTGSNLTSARAISNIVFDQRVDTINSHALNQLFVFFAQFIDHNLAATPQLQRESLNIDVPTADRFLSERVLPFRRSMRAAASSAESSVERPLNTLPSALDLVAVYAPNALRSHALLEFDQAGALTGKLKTSAGNLLPLNVGGFVNAPDTSSRFFLAGDHRANEHPVLTALHTLFVREHNVLVGEIKRLVPSLPPRLLYEYARMLNVAQFQKIVYEEFYPAIIKKPLPRYTGFRPNVNPTLSDIFIGAAFRVGHTMVGNDIPRRGTSGPLSSVRMTDTFFRPANSFSSSELDNFVRGVANSPAQEVDTKIVDSLRNFLFSRVSGEEGFDLVSLNIQRGRDHALPKFNQIRTIFRIPEARTFQDITSVEDTAERLSIAYRGNVDDVEAFPGMLAEDRERGSGMGMTMRAVWESEFVRLRDGDQFFYEQTSKLPDVIHRQLSDWVQKLRARGGVTLRDVILRNSGTRGNQLPAGNIFRLEGSQGSTPRSPPSTDSTPRPPGPSSPEPVPPHPTHLPKSLICGAYVCCAGSCRKCEADKCAERPGSVDICCPGVIYDSGPPCNDKATSPCVIQPSTGERPICGAYTCCPESCGRCEAERCGERLGGVVNCCPGAILESGRKCGGKTTSACII